MATPTILDNVKLDLRITSQAFDSDITTAIASAKQKLTMHGINNIQDTDPLTETAIKLYCRYWYNFQGDADRYGVAFDAVARSMALSDDYKVEPDEQ